MEVYLTGRLNHVYVNANKYERKDNGVLALFKDDKEVASFQNWEGVVEV